MTPIRYRAEPLDNFFQFIDKDFDFYSRQYLRVIEASDQLLPELEHVLYNAHHGFTLQNMLLLAPLRWTIQPRSCLERCAWLQCS